MEGVDMDMDMDMDGGMMDNMVNEDLVDGIDTEDFEPVYGVEGEEFGEDEDENSSDE